MINLATVGTSAICERFLSGVKLCGEFNHVAVCSRNFSTGKQFAEKQGCKTVFCDLLKAAQSDKTDAVYIATPNVFHARQCEIFLKHGKHVICEKPIATSLKEYTELKKIADENGVIYMEAIMPPFSLHCEKVRSAFSILGKPLAARFDFSKRSSRMDAFLRGEHVNIFDMSLCAGTLMDLGVYCVYAAVDFFGKPENITANAHYFTNGADKSGAALFDYGEFDAVLTYSKAANGFCGSEIICENGTLKINSISQYTGVTLFKDGGEETVVSSPSRAEIMCGEAAWFARFIRGGKENLAEYERISERTRTVHECMDKIKKSAGINYPVR